LDRKGEERIEQFGRKKNKEERRGMEKRHKRNIRTIKFTSYTTHVFFFFSSLPEVAHFLLSLFLSNMQENMSRQTHVQHVFAS
jgi:hypothetical protein